MFPRLKSVVHSNQDEFVLASCDRTVCGHAQISQEIIRIRLPEVMAVKVECREAYSSLDNKLGRSNGIKVT